MNLPYDNSLYGESSETKYPPCLNPHCKSYGKSHPNCNCWGGKQFAEGGEVAQYCAEGRPHMPACSHYKGPSFADSVISKRKVK